MSKGRVKEYDSDRGYGSIIDSGSGQKLLVYANFIDVKECKMLKEGQEVEYEIEYQRGENWAIHVRSLILKERI